MKLKDLTKSAVSTNVKGISINKEGDVVDYVPIFNENTFVKLKEGADKMSNDLDRIKNVTLIVEKCKLAYLGDMLTEVVRFKEIDNVNTIRNPYLVEYFEPVTKFGGDGTESID